LVFLNNHLVDFPSPITNPTNQPPSLTQMDENCPCTLWVRCSCYLRAGWLVAAAAQLPVHCILDVYHPKYSVEYCIIPTHHTHEKVKWTVFSGRLIKKQSPPGPIIIVDQSKTVATWANHCTWPMKNNHHLGQSLELTNEKESPPGPIIIVDQWKTIISFLLGLLYGGHCILGGGQSFRGPKLSCTLFDYYTLFEYN